MNAKEAKQISDQTTSGGRWYILDLINEAALNGYTSIEIVYLTGGEKDDLLRLGYHLESIGNKILIDWSNPK